MKIVKAMFGGIAVWATAEPYDYRKVKYTEEGEKILVLEPLAIRLHKVLLSTGLVGYVDIAYFCEVSS